jgi:hypothetical protein
MNFDSFGSLQDIRHKFVEGKSIFYACLLPNFNQFKNEFSITKIFEPIETKITLQNLINATLDSDDKDFLVLNGGPVLRKHLLHIYFENSEKTVISLFVKVDQTILVRYEPYTIFGMDKIKVEKKFYTEIMEIHNKLVQHETKIIENVEFVKFMRLYDSFCTRFPEIILQNIGKNQDINLAELIKNVK